MLFIRNAICDLKHKNTDIRYKFKEKRSTKTARKVKVSI